VSRETLSGGERNVFDAALAYSMRPDCPVIIEAAEIDGPHLQALMEHLAQTDDLRAIILTWYDNVAVPEGWNIVRTAA